MVAGSLLASECDIPLVRVKCGACGRVYVVFVSSAAGGQETLNRVMAKIERIMSQIHEHFEPVSVNDLLLPNVSNGEVQAPRGKQLHLTGDLRAQRGWKSDPNQIQIRSKSDQNQIPTPWFSDPVQIQTISKSDPQGHFPRNKSDPDQIQIRSKSDPNQIQIRSRSDFDPIWIRFRSDFDPIWIRFRSDGCGWGIRFRSDFDPISIRFRSDFDPSRQGRGEMDAQTSGSDGRSRP